MTVFGKILTFVILVLAIAQAALHVMFHINQAKYVAENERMNNSLTAAKAQLDAYQKELDDQKQQGAAAVAKEQDVTKKVQDELATAKKANADLLNKVAMLEHQVDQRVVDQLKNDSDVKAREKQVAQLAKAVEERDHTILEVVKTGKELRAAKVQAEILANSLQTRNDGLVEKIAEMEKDLARATAASRGTTQVSAAAAGATGTVKNPPQANVEGLITRTDPSGMVTISVGSDSGVVKGNTLEVFRLNPPKYLGTIRILESKPNEAVGKPVNKPMGQIQQGDRVAAKIL